MISKYERNIGTPSLTAFQKIVSALQFPVQFFIEKDTCSIKSKGTFYRSKLTATQTEKKPSEFYQKAACYVRDYFEDYVEFPKLSEIHESFDNPAEAANYIRKVWGLGNNPIPNMMRLLEEHGMVVYIAANNSKKVNAHSGWVSINKHMYFIVALDSNSNTFLINNLV